MWTKEIICICLENHRQITKITKIGIQLYFKEIPIRIGRVDNTTIKYREVFLQVVYMLLYYPTLQHAFIRQFVLRKYSSLLFLLKVFDFFHFFSKIAQESRHSIKHCAKLFLFISRYLFRKIF